MIEVSENVEQTSLQEIILGCKQCLAQEAGYTRIPTS